MTLHSEGRALSLAPPPIPPTLLAPQMKAECIYSPACRPAASGRGITLAMMNKRGLIQKQALAHPMTHSPREQGSPRCRRGILPRALFCFHPSDFSTPSPSPHIPSRGLLRHKAKRCTRSVVALNARLVSEKLEVLFAWQRFGFSVEFISMGRGIATY